MKTELCRAVPEFLPMMSSHTETALAEGLEALPAAVVDPTERSTARQQSAILVLVMITAVYVVSYMDRQIFALLLPEINRDIAMTDTQIGQLTGIAFPVVYALFSLIAAVVADRLNRIRLIGFCVALFSVMTASCGAAQGFWSMFLARLGVGIGEGGTAPPSLSLIADHFDGPRRQWANSVYATAGVFGMLGAYILIGNISVWFGWRVAFYCAGALGLVVAACVLISLREAPNRTNRAMKLTDLREFPALFRIKSFRWAMGAAILHTILTESTVQWLPLFLSRSLALSQLHISWFLGIGYSILGLAGIALGTAFATRLRKRSVGSPQYLGTAVTICITLAYTTACLSDSAAITLGMLAIVIFLTISCYGALLAFVQDVTPEDSHAKASAILFLLMQLGLGVGSLSIGILSDTLVPIVGQVESLRYALLPVVIIAGFCASICYFKAGRSADADAWLPISKRTSF